MARKVISSLLPMSGVAPDVEFDFAPTLLIDPFQRVLSSIEISVLERHDTVCLRPLDGQDCYPEITISNLEFLGQLIPTLADMGLSVDGNRPFIEGSFANYVCTQGDRKTKSLYRDFSDRDIGLNITISGKNDADNEIVSWFYSKNEADRTIHWAPDIVPFFQRLFSKLEDLFKTTLIRLIMRKLGDKAPSDDKEIDSIYFSQVQFTRKLDYNNFDKSLVFIVYVGSGDQKPLNYSFVFRTDGFPFPKTVIYFSKESYADAELHSTVHDDVCRRGKVLSMTPPGKNSLFLLQYAYRIARGWHPADPNLEDDLVQGFFWQYSASKFRSAEEYSDAIKNYLRMIENKHCSDITDRHELEMVVKSVMNVYLVLIRAPIVRSDFKSLLLDCVHDVLDPHLRSLKIKHEKNQFVEAVTTHFKSDQQLLQPLSYLWHYLVSASCMLTLSNGCEADALVYVHRWADGLRGFVQRFGDELRQLGPDCFKENEAILSDLWSRGHFDLIEPVLDVLVTAWELDRGNCNMLANFVAERMKGSDPSVRKVPELNGSDARFQQGSDVAQNTGDLALVQSWGLTPIANRLVGSILTKQPTFYADFEVLRSVLTICQNVEISGSNLKILDSGIEEYFKRLVGRFRDILTIQTGTKKGSSWDRITDEIIALVTLVSNDPESTSKLLIHVQTLIDQLMTRPAGSSQKRLRKQRAKSHDLAFRSMSSVIYAYEVQIVACSALNKKPSEIPELDMQNGWRALDILVCTIDLSQESRLEQMFFALLYGLSILWALLEDQSDQVKIGSEKAVIDLFELAFACNDNRFDYLAVESDSPIEKLLPQIFESRNMLLSNQRSVAQLMLTHLRESTLPEMFYWKMKCLKYLLSMNVPPAELQSTIVECFKTFQSTFSYAQVSEMDPESCVNGFNALKELCHVIFLHPDADIVCKIIQPEFPAFMRYMIVGHSLFERKIEKIKTPKCGKPSALAVRMNRIAFIFNFLLDGTLPLMIKCDLIRLLDDKDRLETILKALECVRVERTVEDEDRSGLCDRVLNLLTYFTSLWTRDQIRDLNQDTRFREQKIAICEKFAEFYKCLHDSKLLEVDRREAFRKQYMASGRIDNEVVFYLIKSYAQIDDEFCLSEGLFMVEQALVNDIFSNGELALCVSLTLSCALRQTGEPLVDGKAEILRIISRFSNDQFMSLFDQLTRYCYLAIGNNSVVVLNDLEIYVLTLHRGLMKRLDQFGNNPDSWVVFLVFEQLNLSVIRCVSALSEQMDPVEEWRQAYVIGSFFRSLESVGAVNQIVKRLIDCWTFPDFFKPWVAALPPEMRVRIEGFFSDSLGVVLSSAFGRMRAIGAVNDDKLPTQWVEWLDAQDIILDIASLNLAKSD